MAKLLITLILLAGLLLVADLGVTLVAEQRAATQVSEVLDAPAEVNLRPWPVSWHLLSGRVPRADIAAADVPLGGGAQLDTLDVTLEGVRIRWRDLTEPADRLPPADDGRFTAQLDEAAVQELLGLPEQIVGVSLAEPHLLISLADLVEVEADVEADDGQLVIVPRADVADLFGAARIPVDLSQQPGRPAVTDAEVRDGFLVVHGMLREVNG
jgi:hypothetical protein